MWVSQTQLNTHLPVYPSTIQETPLPRFQRSKAILFICADKDIQLTSVYVFIFYFQIVFMWGLSGFYSKDLILEMPLREALSFV